jgi:DNA-binding beta-propeller fold protein YncE
LWSGRLPVLERLEDRTLLSVSPLPFTAFQTAHADGYLRLPNQVDLYQVHLSQADSLSITVNSQASGGSLQSILRVFDASGKPLALDDQEGGDPRLTFQAPATGDYLVAVSSAGKAYNPNDPSTDPGGQTTGLYALDLRRTPEPQLVADVAGSSFRAGATTAVPGATAPVSFTVESRGGIDPGSFQVQVLLANNQLFNNSTVVRTFNRSSLVADATGLRFSAPANFSVTVPPGQASGPLFVGLKIIPDSSLPDAGLPDKSGVHRGVDWEPLTVLSRVAASPAHGTQASALGLAPNSQVLDTLGPGGINWYQFSVPGTAGSGRLSVQLASLTAGPLRLSLYTSNGQLLVQSDSDAIAQSLSVGNYYLSVTGQSVATSGAYILQEEFVQGSLPAKSLTVSGRPGFVAAGDLTGNGIPDLVTANNDDGTVSVLLGNGDGTFRSPLTLFVGPNGGRPDGVAVADVNGDGKLDIISSNDDGISPSTVSVFLGNGDGTFQAPATFTVGTSPRNVVVADLNGDGSPDIVTADYGTTGARGSGSVSVLFGNGDGTFGGTFDSTSHKFTGSGKAVLTGINATTVAVADLAGDGTPDLVVADYGTKSAPGNSVEVLPGGHGSFGFPTTYTAGTGAYSVQVAHLRGDGKPLDLVVANRIDSTVSVLLGSGTGSFGNQTVSNVGPHPVTVAVADVNGDGNLDLITANYGDNTASVLLGNGDGTFQGQQTFAGGFKPSSAVLADLNSDGKPDLVVADFGSHYKPDNEVTVLLGNGDGSFPVPSTFTVGARPLGVAVTDVNGDGKPDVITANRYGNSVSVLLGNGDGSFQPTRNFLVAGQAFAVAAADLNGDGRPDLAVATYDPTTGKSFVSVLLGDGDGTFAVPRTYAIKARPYGTAIADIDGDGTPDILVTNTGTLSNPDDSAAVLLGDGFGNFHYLNNDLNLSSFQVGSRPTSVVVANVDGAIDLITANSNANTVSVLQDDGHGSFGNRQDVNVGTTPFGLAVVNLKGHPLELVVSNFGDSSVSVLKDDGQGKFSVQQTVSVGREPRALAAADLNGDGIPDVVVPNQYDNTLEVLLGAVGPGGEIAFAPSVVVPVGSYPSAVAVADLTGDGNPDIVATNKLGNSVSVLLGDSQGNFTVPQTIPVGTSPATSSPDSVAAADLNGIPYLATANSGDNTVSVLTADAQGTYTLQQTVPVGSFPASVALAELNGIDYLAVANESDDTVSVLERNSQGDFVIQQTISVGSYPAAVALADLNGTPTLAVANAGDNTISVLEADGSGNFHYLNNDPAQGTFSVGTAPLSVAAADFNGVPYLVTANAFDNTVSVLEGDGLGNFPLQKTFAVGAFPTSVALADIDGTPYLATANTGDNTFSVLLGDGQGNFALEQTIPVGFFPAAVALANLNGIPYLVTANAGDNTVSVLQGEGAGSFALQEVLPTGQLPLGVAVADGPDPDHFAVVTANYGDGTISVLTANTASSFGVPATGSSLSLQNTPTFADLTGHAQQGQAGLLDSVILGANGDILLRRGQTDSNNPFAPPVPINPGHPALDMTVLRTPSGWAVAAIDLPDASSGAPVYGVSLYAYVNGAWVRSAQPLFTTFNPPSRLFAHDLNGDGLDDLVLANSATDTVTVALQNVAGHFTLAPTHDVGGAPADVAFVNGSGSSGPDIVVSNQQTGDISVLVNDPSHSFATVERFRAAPGLVGLGASPGSSAIASPADSVSVAVGDFLGSGRDDLVVINRGTHSFSVLANDGNGGFANPSVPLTTDFVGLTPDEQPGPAVAFQVGGKTFLAVLMENPAGGVGSVWVYANDGHGHFTLLPPLLAGVDPTGLTAIAGPHGTDLLVGNPFGDVLRLNGDGQGTFAPQSLPGIHTTLDAQSLQPGAPVDVLLGNQKGNAINVQTPGANGITFQQVQTVPMAATKTAASLTPNDVHWMLVNGPAGSTYYAVTMGTGSNSVQVARVASVNAAGVPTFAGVTDYAVGNHPVGVTIADLNGDGIPDMIVANQGSNDVSILFGSLDSSGHWQGTPGPRLNSGGLGPVATALRDVTGDGIPDLVVTNAQSGTLAVLPGRGQGFFDDRTPEVITFGAPVGEPSINADGKGVVPTADGRLLSFDLTDLAEGAQVAFTPPEGEQVNAAQMMSNGTVFVALTGGQVEELTAGPTGGFSVAESFTSQSGIPSNPSALEVLSSGEVLVTEAGEGTIFVFTPVVPEVAEVSLPTLEAPGSPVAEISTADESLTPSVTLVAANLVDNSDDSGSSTSTTESSESAALTLTVLRPSSLADDEETEVALGTGNSSIDVDEQLRQLELYEPTPNPNRDGPARDQRALPSGQEMAGVAVLEEAAEQLAAWSAPPMQGFTPGSDDSTRGYIPEHSPAPPAVESLCGGVAPGGVVGTRGQLATETEETTCVPADAATEAAVITDAVFQLSPQGWEQSLPFLAVAAGGLGLWLRENARPTGVPSATGNRRPMPHFP